MNIERIYDPQLIELMLLNEAVFGDRQVINHWEAEDIRMYLAKIEGQNVGFKIGYRLNEVSFYSAKGGVLPLFRRQGIALSLLHFMIEDVQKDGYRNFIFDTFPNLNPGMTILALKAGFQVTLADYNPQYKDFRLRFEKELAK